MAASSARSDCLFTDSILQAETSAGGRREGLKGLNHLFIASLIHLFNDSIPSVHAWRLAWIFLSAMLPCRGLQQGECEERAAGRPSGDQCSHLRLKPDKIAWMFRMISLVMVVTGLLRFKRQSVHFWDRL
jgi:hypothetical protein